MAVTATPALPQTPQSGVFQITSTMGTALQTVYTGGVNGSKITAIIGTSTDASAAHDIQIGITKSSTFYVLGTISVPSSAGNGSATPSVNLLDPTIIKGLPVDSDGQIYIFLSGTAATIQTKALTAVSTGVWLNIIGADF